jgi:hypothetical protein
VAAQVAEFKAEFLDASFEESLVDLAVFASPGTASTATGAASTPASTRPPAAMPGFWPPPRAQPSAARQTPKFSPSQSRLDRYGVGLYREHSASKRSHGPPGLRQEISREGRFHR